MEHLFTLPNLATLIAIMLGCISLLKAYKSPAIDLEKRLMELESKNPTVDLEKKMALIEQQLAADIKIAELVTNLRDNHIHSIESKMNEMGVKVDALTTQFTKIETILNERLPNKNM